MHPAVFPLAIGIAAIAGIGLRAGRSALTGAVLAAAVALNIFLSIQALSSIRLAALATACALVGAGCAAMRAGDGRGSGLLLATVALTGTALALDGLYQVLFGFEAATREAGALSEAVRARLASGRAVSTLGLPGALGGFLGMSIPVTAAWIWRRPAGPVIRVAGVLLIAVQGAGLLATRSASSLAALAAAGAVVGWVRAADAVPRRRRPARIAAVLVLLAGIAAAAILLAARLSGPGAVDEGRGPLTLRAGNWKVAAEMAATWPMLGAGLGTYGTAFPNFREWGMNESRFAHNSYLQVLAEGGVLIGLPLIWIAARLTRRLTRAAAGTPEEAFLALGGIAFLAHNAVDFTAFLPTTVLLFACVAGRAWGMDRGMPAARGGRAFPLAVALLLAGTAAWIGRAEMLRDGARDLAAHGRVEEAMERARRAIRLNPIDPDARFLLSSLLLNRGPDDGAASEALDQARAACALDPRTPHRWQHLARARLARRDPIGAYLAITRAVDLYPIREEYRAERDAIALRIVRPSEASP